jgi:hypothetical protein
MGGRPLWLPGAGEERGSAHGVVAREEGEAELGWRDEEEECHTPFFEIGNEASIRVPRMFKSHAWQQYDKQMQCY